MAALAIELVIGLGGMLLTALFTPKPRNQWGSRLSNINVPSVSPGNVIPRVWGTMKIPATMIFASPLIETMHTHQAQQKKGGKGLFGGNAAKTFTFTYSIDAAWAICLGPIYRVNRIWANQKLLYVDPVVQSNSQAAFDAAYQAEATRLIDEEGVDLDHAAASAFVFAFNNYNTAEVTLSSPAQAVSYITSHPIDDTLGVTHAMLYPDSGGVTAIIDQLYSSLNNQNTYLSQINRFDLIEIYLGTDGQGPNGLLEGYLGLGNAPAFRNCAYFVITNLQLMDFGNAVPTMTAEVQRTADGKTTLVQIMTDLCYQAGLTEGQFDAQSNVDQTSFPGFAITSNQSAREAVSELQKVFPIDAAESGYGIVFNMLNQRATQIVDVADLAAHVDTEPVPPRQEVTVMSDYDLPQRINLKFQEPARSYSPNALYAARYNTPSMNIEDLDVTVALDRNTAQTAVQNLLAHRMLGKRSYKFMLPRKYATLEPTDVFRIQNPIDPSRYDQFYCTEAHVGANGLLEIHAVDHVYVDPNLAPTDQVADDLSVATGGSTGLPTTSQTVPFLLDMPLMLDTDSDKPGFYVIMAGAFNGWGGGSLYVDVASSSIASAYGYNWTTMSSGSAWEAVASSSINVPQGTCLTALASGMHSCFWDRKSSVLVKIANGMTLQSASEGDCLSQALNVTVIGNELVQYATATDLGNSLWKLTNFMRGLRGTERWMDSHATGDRFVRVTAAIARVITTKAEIGAQDSFRAISVGQDSSTAVNVNFTDTGNSLKPLTVKVYEKFRDKDTHDVRVSWWPRVRQNGQWLSGSDVTVPPNDSPETYQVDVCRSADPTTAVKSYTLTGAGVNLGASFTYSAAQQVSDLGGAPAVVYLVVYQMSQAVGKGFGIGVKVS
jgi:hypothetical protein